MAAIARCEGQRGIAPNMAKIGHEQSETQISPIHAEALMNPLLQSRYYYPQTNGKRFPKPLEVRKERWLARNFQRIEAVARTAMVWSICGKQAPFDLIPMSQTQTK